MNTLSAIEPVGPTSSQLPQFGGLLKLSRRDSIAELLRKAILRGELKPGQRLAENRLAKSLGVSQVYRGCDCHG